jgi:tRNA threonylcarbamoyladenosine biosynthesis protein TsaB
VALGAVVAFDTATDDTVVGALRDGELIHEAVRPPPEGGRPLHATALLAEVEAAAQAAGGWESVAVLGVGTGPGSFTGIRIGIATAKALAAALPLRLTGLGTLDALAAGARDEAEGRPLAAVIDGRRGEVFAALYDAEGRRTEGPLVDRPDAFAQRLAQAHESPLAVGSGALRFQGELADRGIEVPAAGERIHRVAARSLCSLAEAGHGSPDPAAQYLRAPDAERWHERADLTRT